MGTARHPCFLPGQSALFQVPLAALWNHTFMLKGSDQELACSDAMITFAYCRGIEATCLHLAVGKRMVHGAWGPLQDRKQQQQPDVDAPPYFPPSRDSGLDCSKAKVCAALVPAVGLVYRLGGHLGAPEEERDRDDPLRMTGPRIKPDVQVAKLPRIGVMLVHEPEWSMKCGEGVNEGRGGFTLRQGTPSLLMSNDLFRLKKSFNTVRGKPMQGPEDPFLTFKSACTR